MSFKVEYGDLLAEHLPRPIESERENTRALRVADRLMQKGRLTKAEETFLQLLTDLIVKYESKVYGEPDVSPAELLAFLIQESGISQAELARQTGIGRSTISQILSGERGVSVAAAGKLGRHFRVAASAFLPT